MGFPSRELEFCESSTVSARSGVTSSYSGTVEVHLAIYQVVVRCWSWIAAARQRLHDFLHKLKVLGMIPVTEEDGTEINIIVGIRWTMNNERSKKSTYICQSTVVKNKDLKIVDISYQSIEQSNGNGTTLFRTSLL